MLYFLCGLYFTALPVIALFFFLATITHSQIEVFLLNYSASHTLNVCAQVSRLFL